ncbi:hypothetical protein Z949_2914 [Sulfitobacter guttiformis KCTC 32187]|nr:hypothetical protein Z949_2914 [Sulfitobacter guttiformis KCTC 32187]
MIVRLTKTQVLSLTDKARPSPLAKQFEADEVIPPLLLYN